MPIGSMGSPLTENDAAKIFLMLSFIFRESASALMINTFDPFFHFFVNFPADHSLHSAVPILLYHFSCRNRLYGSLSMQALNLPSILNHIGDCETHYFKTAVVQNRQIASRTLCRRRCLDAVFWRLMHRCERQCSESVPCGDCLFCTTEAFENIVSQLPT